MLALSHISKVYRTGKVEARALNDVSLNVARGEFMAVLGPSGCGKSTLLNIMGLLDRPSAGSYRLMGEEVTVCGERILTRLRSDHIGFIFQSFNLIDELTVEENVGVSLLHEKDSGSRRKRTAEALEQVGMAQYARHRPQYLSGGQQQRVAIARALVSRPDLILADEPTGNLDTANGDLVMHLLKAVSAVGTTIVMATHSSAHAAAAGRTVKMLDGRIVSETQL